MSKQVIITLPSFLRRILKAYALKAEIRALGCQLHRIGRSRNWQLKAQHQQLVAIVTAIESANEPSWLWLAKLLRQHYETITHEELVHIARKNINISINELISKTDCTLVQARKVIDEIEDLD